MLGPHPAPDNPTIAKGAAMTRKIRIGVQIQQQHAPDYQTIRDAVSRVEDAGVDIIFNWDHFYPLHGDPDGPHFGDG